MFGGHFSGLFFIVFCPTAGLQLSKVKLKTVGTAFFLSTSWQSLKEGPNKTPYRKILFQAAFGKVLRTNVQMLRGRKVILFIFMSHSLLSFGSWETSKYYLWTLSGFLLKFAVNFKPKQCQITRIS